MAFRLKPTAAEASRPFGGTTPLRAIFRGTAWTGLAVASSRLLSGVMTIILARWLEPRELGVISFVLAYYNMIMLIADWSMGYAVQKLIPENPSATARVAWTAFVVRLSFSAALGIVCIALDMAAGIFHGYGVYMALLLITSAFGIIIFVRLGCCHFVTGSLMAIALQLGWLAVSVALVRMGMRITGPLLALCVSYAVLGMTGFVLSSSLRRDIAFVRSIALEILHFGLWATVATALNEFVGQIGILVITYSMGDAAGGIFKVASTFGMLPALLGTMVLLPLMPVARESLLKGEDISRRLVLPIFRHLLMVGLPIAAAGFVLAPAVIHTFVQQSYQSAAWPMRILLLANLVRMLVTAFSGILFVGDGLRELAKIQGSVALIAVVGSLILARKGGATGVAAALLISWLVGAVHLYRWFAHRMPLRLEWGRYLRYAGSAGVTAAFTLFAGSLLHPGIEQLALGGCVAAVVYVFLLWVQRDLAFRRLVKVLGE